MASSPPSSGVLPPSYPLRLREPSLTLRNPRSILPVADVAALLLRAAYEGDVPQLKSEYSPIATPWQPPGCSILVEMWIFIVQRVRVIGFWLLVTCSAGEAAEEGGEERGGGDDGDQGLVVQGSRTAAHGSIVGEDGCVQVADQGSQARCRRSWLRW